MIVKIRNNTDEGWRYLEGNEILTEYLAFNKIKDIPVNTETFLTHDLIVGKETVKIITFHTYGAKENKTLITDRLCYLLNDNGKTIDRL